MKVSKAQSSPQQVNFKGIKKSKDNNGFESYKFYLPYDKDKFNSVKVEIKEVKKDGNRWVVGKNLATETLKDRAVVFEPDLDLNDNQHFAYRFVLDGKDGKKSYQTDNGTYATGENNDSYTLILRNRGYHNRPGQMMHLMPDNYNPGCTYFDKNGKLQVKDVDAREKAKNATRTHFNQLGGNISGIIAKIPEMKEMGIHKVLSTPLFGQDEISSHGYWTTNPYQVSNQNGTMDDFKKMQVELFKNDMGLVADGAFVNEGLEGAHFKHVLKWGEKSPYATWFKSYGLESGPLELGVIPNVEKDADVLKHVKLKVVNAPKKYEFTESGVNKTENKEYDKTQPTFVQLYDDRLASKKQQTSNEIIRRYDNLNAKSGNMHEIATHNDSVLPYAFEIDAEELDNNIKNVSGSYDKKNTTDFYKAILTFDDFAITAKKEGGFFTWDGNVDIAKLNYMYSKQDEATLSSAGKSKEEKRAFEQGGYQVQDYIQNVASFWTSETKKSLLNHTLQQLSKVENKTAKGYDSVIDKAVEDGELPESSKEVMSKDVLDNIVKGHYEFKQEDDETKTKDFIVGNLMKYPLDSLEFAPDLTAVLASPFISKRAFTKSDVGKERIDMMKNYDHIPSEYKNVYQDVDQRVYREQMYAFTKEVIQEFDSKSKIKLLNKNNEATEAGRFLIPIIASDIARFALVKALAPDAVETNSGKGTVSYKLDEMKKTGLKKVFKSQDIDSPEKEAKLVARRLRKGIARISDDDKTALAKNLAKKYEDNTLTDVKVAMALLDRTESGLSWRIDATKDVIDLDYVKSGRDNFSEEWVNAIDFWKGFNDKVKEENPNAYVVAELTDVDHFAKGGKYNNYFEAESDFVEKTGMSAVSNYKYFYSFLPQLVSPLAEDGSGAKGSIKELKNKVLLGLPERNDDGSVKPDHQQWPGNIGRGYLRFMPNDSVKHTHNFFSNHDKPRILHSFALDMQKFHRLNYDSDDVKNFAEKLAEEKGNDEVQEKSLAMASKIYEKVSEAVEDKDLHFSHNDQEKIKSSFKLALTDFVKGEHLDNKNIDPDAFGTKPFDKVIESTIKQAESKYDLKLSKKEEKKLEAKTLELILTPAMAKYRTILKALTVLPGDSTMYAGDELGETGYETPFKNVYVQNRNMLHWEWLNEPGMGFVKDHYKEVEKISQLRRSDKGLSALNGGETVALSVGKADGAKQDNPNVMAMYRYDDKSAAICLININQGNAEHFTNEGIGDVYIDEAYGEGLHGGMKAGVRFKDVESGKEYKAVNDNDRIVLRDKENKKITMTDNVMVLKQIDDVTFGRKTGNYLKIQAYLGKNMMPVSQKDAV